jgi:hypothetical protein
MSNKKLNGQAEFDRRHDYYERQREHQEIIDQINRNRFYDFE